MTMKLFILFDAQTLDTLQKDRETRVHMLYIYRKCCCQRVYCKYSQHVTWISIRKENVCAAPALFHFMNFLKHKMKEARNGVRKKSKKLSKNQLLHGHHCDIAMLRCCCCNTIRYSSRFLSLKPNEQLLHTFAGQHHGNTQFVSIARARPGAHTHAHAHTLFTMQYVISNILGSIIFIHLVN